MKESLYLGSLGINKQQALNIYFLAAIGEYSIYIKYHTHRRKYYEQRF